MQDQARHFLFLQGPHGPFFARLAKRLHKRGHRVSRVGFNAADRAFWPWSLAYIKFNAPQDTWDSTVTELISSQKVTDIVLYGDVRAYHRIAVQAAKALGATVHVFEEGYLRPYWITYERGGSNGHSRLIEKSVDELIAQTPPTAEAPIPPATWGELRQHVFYGALYHGIVLLGGLAYPNFTHHRPTPLIKEWRNYARRLVSLPFAALERGINTRALLRKKTPYFIVLLQLEHDSAMQEHSPFQTHVDFAREVITRFAMSDNTTDLLVFKSHPLEPRQWGLRRDIERLAREHNIAERVKIIGGGKLAKILTPARGAITLNSTAGQQVLLRGMPLKTYGQAIYAKEGFVSTQSTTAFFKSPQPPDRAAYNRFRKYLLQTSQIAGGFYAATGRHKALGTVVEKMLHPQDPYGLD